MAADPNKPKPSTHLLYGESYALIKERFEALLSDLQVGDDNDFDTSEYDATETPGDQILAAVTTLPFLAAFRLTIVHRADRLHQDTIEKLTQVIPALPASIKLILVFESVEKQTEAVKPLFTTVKKLGGLIECAPPRQQEIAVELEKRAKRAGYTLDKGAAQALVLRTDGSFGDSLMELEKLFAHCAATKLITANAVNEIVPAGASWRVFELLDAVAEGKLGATLSNWRLLESAEGKPEEAALRALFPQLSRQLRMLWQARACQDLNLPLHSEQASLICPERHSLPAFSSKSEWAAGKTMRLASKLSRQQISRMMELLVESEKRIKGQLSSISPRDAVERMLAEMCAAASTTHAR